MIGVDDQETRCKQQAVLDWLNPIDYDYAAQHSDIVGRRPGTGQWLLDSDEF
ncbi:hypothetical protein VTG60DRAFT_4630 [Thermothelomyces hinnuleus]